MTKIVFPLVLFVAVSLVSFCQVGYGPELGIGSASMKFVPMTTPIDYTSASTGSVASGKIGGIVDVPINKHVYFQVGADLSRKGAVRDFSYYHNDSFNSNIHQELDMYYFDLPAYVTFKTGTQGRGRFFGSLGATVSYIVSGRNKLYEHQVFNDTLSVTSTNDPLSIGNTVFGFDIGANFKLGYELNTGLYFCLYYTAGVKDIGVGTEMDKNRIWGIAAGYLLGKGRNINTNKEAEDLIDRTPG